MKHTFIASALIVAAATPSQAQNRIDGQSPDAPALSAYGAFDVGVRQFDFVNPNQVDILSIDPEGPKPAAFPTYDRPLSVETWYPSVAGAVGDTSLKAFIRDGTTEVALEGRAVRDAAALNNGDAFPLIILSHGYPGNRFLVSHLAENLASKGYVVAAIDHTDSTYRDQNAFGSTLVNRSLDQVFVVNQMAALNVDQGSGLAGMIDADNTGVIGYSMGGYGAVITAGGGVTQAAVDAPFSAPQGALDVHLAGSASHEALSDERIKTAIAIGPWGRQFGLFDEEGLAGVDIPMLFIGGSDDTVSGYDTGIRKFWEDSINVDRALLTFDGGSHNTVAPIPAPQESFYFNDALGFDVSEHYTDPVWDTVFMNNVGQHFATAWLDDILKGDVDKQAFLDLIDIGSDGVYAQNADGSFADAHTYWAGFGEGTAAGLRFERLSAVPLPASVWLLGAAIGGLGALRRRKRA